MDESVLRQLYLGEGLSAGQIADKLETPVAKVVYWLRKYRIPKRSISEAVYLRFNADGDPFNAKQNLTLDEEKLKVAVLVLWVTEGSPKDKDIISTSNSDPALIALFVEFLLRICQVEKSKIRLRVMYYPNMDMNMDETRRFWTGETGLDESQIKMNTYRATHNYHAKSKYGTATVVVANVKLHAQMRVWLKELNDVIMASDDMGG